MWALHSPKGIHSHSKNPNDPIVKAVHCLDVSSISTCQKPKLKSKLENIWDPSKLSKVLLDVRERVAILLVLTFNFLKSMQKQRPLYFFWTRMTTLHQGLLLGQIAPACNMSLTCVLTSSNNGGGVCLNCSLKDSSSVTLMLCLTWLAHPNSLSSREKISWYSINNSQACFTCSSGHLFRPDRSKVDINFSWHCSTLRVGIRFSDAFKDSNVPGFKWGWGTSLVACTCATFCPFLRWMGDPVVLHSTMGTVILPCLRTV